MPKNKKKFNSKNIFVKKIIKKEQNNKKEISIKTKNNINNKEKEVKANDKIIIENSNNANNEQKENDTNSDLKPNIEKVENVDNNTHNNKVNDFHKILEISKKECELCHKKIVSHLYKIHYNTHASEIFPWLYLGSFNNACDIEELERIKATHVLNSAYECNNEKLPKDIKELHLNIRVEKWFDLIDFFEEANIFMNKVKMNGGIILVYCKFGISRSATFIIAYLIKYC
jgi:protein-tyrosine phosphatase